MKIFILFISFFLSAILFVQAQPTIDFETGGNGAAYTWTVFENDTPPMEIVTNPNASGGNTSSMVAKMRVLQTNANYAGVVTRSFTPFTLSASNSIVKIMVYKSVISDVGIKFEANFASTGEIKVANTKINEWEELTFDFSGKIGEASSTNIDGIVIFPDFNTRTAETITHFDNLTFSASSTGGGGATALPVDFEDAGGPYTFNDFEGGAASVIDNPGSAGINTSAKVAQMKKFAGATYGGTTLALDGTVDFSAGSIVKMKVWASRAVPVTLKLEGLNVERVVSHTGSGTWEELSFDFTGSTGAGVAAITLIFDNGIAGDAAGNSANWTFYFDDIKLAAALPPNTSVSTIDFETPGNGAAYTWNVFENDTPPLEIVANPSANGINTSATVAKMRVLQTNANYAGTVTRSFTPFTLDASNSIVKIMVYKNVISDVGIKFEANFASTGEIKVANTKINEWEELTFDFTGKIGQPSSTKIDGLVIFPDFNTRTGETISYFDNIRFTSQSTGGGDPTSPALPLDFQSSTIDYTFSDFEGGAVTVIDNPQSNGINTSSKVGKMVKNPGAVYAGSLIALASPIDFSTNKTFKVKVFMPKVGAKLLLKVENLTDNTKNYEKEATGTVANAWEELTFDYSAINTANQYQKIILIFDLGTAGDGGANFTYLFDDIRLTTDGGTTPTLPVLPLDFQSATTDYTFSDFEGGVVTVIDNPQSNTINTSTKVGKMVKNAGAVYAGSLITLASPMDFSSNKIFKVKVFMPKVGAKLLLKVENLTDASKNYEKEVTGTVANAWEELTFDYSAINTANQYQKIILIFDNGTVGDGSANFTYLFDDLRLTTSGGNVSTSPVLPLDFESTTITYAFTDFNGGGTTVISNPQISGINTSATVGKMIKSAGQVWGGSWTSLASPIDFSVNKAFKVKVFMPRVGAKLLLKVENQTNGAVAFEKEATGTVANAWEELTFDYSTINTANQYQKLVLIFDLGTNGDGTANFTYLFDDIRLVASNGGEVTLTQMNLPVTFDVATVEYGLAGFGGADASTVVTDPTLSTNKVAKVVKSAGAETWAGTTITAVSGNVQTGFSSKIPFTTSEKKMNVRVWSPDAGVKVLMKVEDYLDPSKSVETSATTTVAGNWETLNFDFGIQSEGTAALNLAYNYNKASIFFNFGVTGAVAGEKTYYFDDVKFGAAVILQSQTITFPAITDKTAGGASFALTATASSGLAVTYSTTSDKITISGSQVTIVKAGRASVTASQDGNASFNPAVSVENSFCIKPAKPVITINGGNTEAVTLTSSATAGNQWYLNGTAITNATNATVAATSQGLYKVKVTVDDCVSEFSDETALIVTGDIQTLFKQVSAYPNPAENYLEVRGIEGELSNAQLFDLTGRANMIVFERNGDVHQANVQHVTKGVYLLKLTAGNKIHQIKIIKN